MPKRKDQESLLDIQEAIVRIAEYVAGLSFEQFLKDRRTMDAVIRNLEIIGEATKALTPSMKKAHTGIPWKELGGMRDKMIHHYFGINYEIVWTVAKERLPDLLPRIIEMLKQ